MLEYARWKYILIAAVLALACLFAVPNLFGDDPAMQVGTKDHSPMTAVSVKAVESYLKQQEVPFETSYIESGNMMVRFASVADQLKARDAVNGNPQFKDTYITALSFAPRTPPFLRALGLRPMSLGLDLRGGLYLLYQVDLNSAVSQLLEGYVQDARHALTSANIQYKDVATATVGSEGPDSVRIVLAPGTDVDAARKALSTAFQGVGVTNQSLPDGGAAIVGTLSPTAIRERQDYAITQSITTLRNRVNELGVSEPKVERQGLNRITVELPGVANSAEVKNILGRTATLEFRLEDQEHNPLEAAETGHVPIGSKLYTHTRVGRPVLLKREVIATGDQLTSATSTQTQEGPAVSVKLDARGGESMLKTTRVNVGHHMAVVLIEKHAETTKENGKEVTRFVTDENVINVATIHGVFSDRFDITGLTTGEAHDLALLLRSGSLPTAIALVDERVIGASLGQDNIDKGMLALKIGMLGVFASM